MPTGGKTTLTQFLIEERRRAPSHRRPERTDHRYFSFACKAIA
jgi:hypothetical protein